MPMLLTAVGGMLLIELGYQVGLKSSDGPIRVLFGIAVNSRSPLPWLVGLALVIGSFCGLRFATAPADRMPAVLRELTGVPHG
jgi:phosphotransferase system  glucose/maltose/N-acetylglucosamine-specific IIC component